MSPIDARIPLQGIPFQPPKFDIGDTYVQLARIQALEAQRRGQDLYNRGQERAIGREDAWQAQMAQVFAPPQAPQGPPQGMTDARQPPPTQGLTAPVMADQVPFASPEQGQYGLTAPPMPQGMPPSFERAPSTLQAPAMVPGAPGHGLTAPQGPLPPMSMGGGGPSATSPPPVAPPGGGLTAAQDAPARKPSQFGQMFQPLNMDALQQAYALDPEKTGQWHARHVQMQGQKIAQAKQMTGRMYSVLKGIVGSDNQQQAYEIGLQQLREEGIPLPKDLPPTYDHAWGVMTLGSLRTAEMEAAELEGRQKQAELELTQYKAVTERHKAAKEMQQVGGEGEYRDTPQGQVWVPKYAPPGGNVDARPVTMGGQPVGGPLQVQQEQYRAELAKQGQTQSNQVRSAEQQAQTHYDNVIAKPYREVRDAMGRISAAGTSPTPAGDMALIYAYMKMLDPSTGIRNEEIKNAELLGGLPSQANRWLEWTRGGKPLTESVRKDFLDRSKKLYGQYQKDYEDVATQYRTQAQRQGLNPDNVVLDYRSTTPAGGRDQASSRPVTEMSLEERRAERDALRGKR